MIVSELPDLTSDVKQLENSVHVQRLRLWHLQCALEEHCFPDSVYTYIANNPGKLLPHHTGDEILVVQVAKFMTQVTYVGCGLEPKQRFGDSISPIRKTKERLDQKSTFEKKWACL